jgi:hypothetical protein
MVIHIQALFNTQWGYRTEEYFDLKLSCLHPVACIRSGSGVSVKRNSVSLAFIILFKLTDTCFGRTTVILNKIVN